MILSKMVQPVPEDFKERGVARKSKMKNWK
jgi:hypothetical protein